MLPKSVLDAKDSFASINKITDLGKSKSNLPMGTSIPLPFDFPTPEIGLLCTNKLTEYNLVGLKVKTKMQGGENIIQSSVGVIAGLMDGYEFLNKKYPNLKPPKTSSKSSKSKIPACLEDQSMLLQVLKNALSAIKYIFKSVSAPLVSLVTDISKYIKTSFDSVLGSLGAGGTIAKITDMITKGFKMLLGGLRTVIFGIFDKIKEFFESTGLTSDIKKLLEYKRCLDTNCKASRPYMMDISFIYVDGNPNKGYLLPMSASGEMSVSRLKNYSASYPVLGTDENKTKLRQMESEYRSYDKSRASSILGAINV